MGVNAWNTFVHKVEHPYNYILSEGLRNPRIWVSSPSLVRKQIAAGNQSACFSHSMAKTAQKAKALSNGCIAHRMRRFH